MCRVPWCRSNLVERIGYNERVSPTPDSATAPRAAEPFPIRDVSAWPARAEEQMGSKRKVWLESPTQESYLFKNVRQDSIGSVYGDDWAEKLAAELAGLLSVPAAAVDLAHRDGNPGVICRRVNDPGVVELVHRRDGSRRLAPSFDHGSSLGFNESPSRMATKALEARDLERWCSRWPQRPLCRPSQPGGRCGRRPRPGRTRCVAALDGPAETTTPRGLDHGDRSGSGGENVRGCPYLRE